jgi:hypothetical protein
MSIRRLLALGAFIVVLLLAAVLASCSNPDQRPMDGWYPMIPTPLAKSPVGLVITDPVFRQKEPDPLIEEGYKAADLTIMTSSDLWNYFAGAANRIDLVGTRITNEDMVARLVNATTKGVQVNIVVEQGFFNSSESAPLISQLIQTGRVTIKTDNDGEARQVHSRYAIIDDHIVLASSGDFLDDTFNTSINNTLIFTSPRYYVDGTGTSTVQTVTDAFLFDFDQMFNQGRFGGDKEILGNHTFNVGVDVEVYFGPNDNLLGAVAYQINNLQSSMSYMINQVTDPEMLGILASFGEMGWYDYPTNGDLTDILPLATPFAWSGYNSLNHKVMVIDVPVDITDASNPTLLGFYDPVVISGSCNWTHNGLKLNDEQLVVVHDIALGYEMGFVEMATISREAAGYGVVFGRTRTIKNVPVANAVVQCDSLEVLGTPFMGDGGTPSEGESDGRGAYFMLVPTGFVKNIHLEDLGDAAGTYLFPDPLWGDDVANQGYNLMPGASFEANFYFRPIPTNTGTGT